MSGQSLKTTIFAKQKINHTMKRYFLILAPFVLATLTSCQPKDEKKIGTDLITVAGDTKGGLANMKFEFEKHDFGRISQGERVTYAFKFKNTGGSNLIISDAHGSCGCTVPSFPKKPVAPGEEGVIDVEFNSEGKRDHQEKTVTLITNCEPNTKVLTITADVMVPEKR
jgi:hypothetical protein